MFESYTFPDPEMDKLREEHKQLQIVLAGLAKRHEGYEQGCGPCICEWHQKAQSLLSKMKV